MRVRRRKRKHRKKHGRRRRHEEDAAPSIDPVLVKARIGALAARWTVPGICLFLAGAVMLVFGQVINHEFIDLGDKAFIYGNPLVTSGLTPGGIFRVFTHVECGFYAPLTMISHMADWQVYGHWEGGHHLTSVLLHGATAIILFLTLRMITGATWRSAFVAVLFAIHPLQVESVAWTAQRNDVLCGFFFILAIAAYTRYVYRPWSLMGYLAVMALFVAGLMSQPTMVALPFVLLLLDYWPFDRCAQATPPTGDSSTRQNAPSIFLRLLIEKIPFFALSCLAFMVTLFARRRREESLETYSLPGRIVHTLVSSVTYIRHTILPDGLTVFYPQSADSKLFWEVSLAIAFLIALSAGAFFLRRRYPYLLIGWLWYLGTLVPTMGWGEGGLHTGADHYTYLPQIGLYIVIAWGAWGFFLSFVWHRAWVISAAMVIAIGVLIAKAETQCSWWHDGEKLWNHALETIPGNYVAHYNLAVALIEKGQADEAITNCQKALDMRPDYAEAHNAMGLALVQKGNLDEAIAHYKKALDLRPKYWEACNNLGDALVANGDLDQSIPCYKKALELNPDYAEAYNHLGEVLVQKNNIPEAISSYKKALAVDPNYAEAHYNMGTALLYMQGNPVEAISYYQRALQIRPDYTEAHYYLGVAFFGQGAINDAIMQWRETLELQPNDEQAHYNLARALVMTGNLDEAIVHYQKALELHPDNAEIYNNIGTAMLQKKQFGYARTNYETALEIDPACLWARNNLAWLLATCPDASIRDGKKAVELIQKQCQLSGDNDPSLLRTLAAAYAETGHFFEALQTARQALQDYEKTKSDPVISDELRHAIQLYEAGSSYHEIP